MQPINPEAFYDESFVSGFFGESVSTTQKRRLNGSGVPFHKFGKLVRYQGRDILQHSVGRRHLSTSVAA